MSLSIVHQLSTTDALCSSRQRSFLFIMETGTTSGVNIERPKPTASGRDRGIPAISR